MRSVPTPGGIRRSLDFPRPGIWPPSGLAPPCDGEPPPRQLPQGPKSGCAAAQALSFLLPDHVAGLFAIPFLATPLPGAPWPPVALRGLSRGTGCFPCDTRAAWYMDGATSEPAAAYLPRSRKTSPIPSMTTATPPQMAPIRREVLGCELRKSR